MGFTPTALHFPICFLLDSQGHAAKFCFPARLLVTLKLIRSKTYTLGVGILERGVCSLSCALAKPGSCQSAGSVLGQGLRRCISYELPEERCCVVRSWPKPHPVQDQLGQEAHTLLNVSRQAIIGRNTPAVSETFSVYDSRRPLLSFVLPM